MSQTIHWQAYDYRINFGANIAFCALFGVQALICFIAFILCFVKAKGVARRNRYTFMLLPFLVGLILECIGYIGRILNHADQNALGPYILQSMAILIAPAFMAATIYMNFGEILKVFNAQKYCLVPLKWLTKVFVCGDVIFILMQAAGGGLQGVGNMDLFNTGKNIIIVGLFVQIFFFGAFVINSTIFAIRFQRSMKECYFPHNNLSDRKSWKFMLLSLYLVCIAILVRSIFRIIEYLQGYGGELVSSETYFFALDAAIIFLGAVVYLCTNISGIVTSLKIAYPNGVSQNAYEYELDKRLVV